MDINLSEKELVEAITAYVNSKLRDPIVPAGIRFTVIAHLSGEHEVRATVEPGGKDSHIDDAEVQAEVINP